MKKRIKNEKKNNLDNSTVISKEVSQKRQTGDLEEVLSEILDTASIKAEGEFFRNSFYFSEGE